MDAEQPHWRFAAFTRRATVGTASFALVHTVVAAALAAESGMAEAARQEVLSERDPLNPIPHITRGLLLDRLGLLDPAIDALEAAVALAPDAREPVRILAGVLTRTTRTREADAALRQALELDPRNPQLMNDRAAVLMRVHRHAEASALLREVLDRQGPHASIVCNFAGATVCLGMQDEAVELARAAIALDPGAVLPRRALANTLPYQDGITGCGTAARGAGMC